MSIDSVCIRFPVPIQGEVKHFILEICRSRAKRNRAILPLHRTIVSIAPKFIHTTVLRVPTEIVFSHICELVVMGLSVRPPLTWDSCPCSVGCSTVIPPNCWLVLTLNIVFPIANFHYQTNGQKVHKGAKGHFLYLEKYSRPRFLMNQSQNYSWFLVSFVITVGYIWYIQAQSNLFPESYVSKYIQ